MIKTIQINKFQFQSLEKVYSQYLKENPNDQIALATIQDIINQCLDKTT
jgi:hypothetical protein